MSESQSTFRLFALSPFSVLRVKNWNWNRNNQKKIAIQKTFIKEFGKYIQKKFDKLEHVNIESQLLSKVCDVNPCDVFMDV